MEKKKKRIKITDLRKDDKISKEEMRKVFGGWGFFGPGRLPVQCTTLVCTYSNCMSDCTALT